MQIDRKVRSDKRKARVRKRIAGDASRPRLSVKFSGKHIYAQCVDDRNGLTLVFLSTLDEEIRKQKVLANVAGAALLGKVFAERVISAGIGRIVFDRGARKYHGCIKTFADAVREAGVLF
ncbi:MAG: 50S ribosomal protein L18 [Puniceicoccales bacterium]|jgi:large subunit ribosomal protein L18|nr:50S ribosomal protein L18 [Puniceicoccales bacterium]